MSNMWPSAFPLQLFVLIDKSSFRSGQSDNFLKLSLSADLPWRCFDVARVEFGFYEILIYNNTFLSSSAAPQSRLFLFLAVSSRIRHVISW